MRTQTKFKVVKKKIGTRVLSTRIQARGKFKRAQHQSWATLQSRGWVVAPV